MTEKCLKLLDYHSMLAVWKALKKMQDGDILYLKNGKVWEYSQGYQIATDKKQAENWKDAGNAIFLFHHNAVVKKENGIFQIEEKHIEYTLYKALEVAQKYNQPYVMRITDNRLIWLK